MTIVFANYSNPYAYDGSKYYSIKKSFVIKVALRKMNYFIGNIIPSVSKK